VKYNTYLVLR